MAILQPPPLTVTLTQAQLEQRLWTAYRLGITTEHKRVYPPQQPEMPQCPRHNIPLWLEPHATADGSWLYCPFCRQDARSSEHRHTDALKTDALRKIHLER